MYKSHTELIKTLNKLISYFSVLTNTFDLNLNDETKMMCLTCQTVSNAHFESSENFLFYAARLNRKLMAHKLNTPVQSSSTVVQLTNHIQDEDFYHDTVSHFSQNLENFTENSIQKIAEKRCLQIKPPQSLSNFRVLITLLRNVNLGMFSLPVSAGFNEPLSYIQRAAEQFQFSYLLDKAAECSDTLEQMVYVVGFDVASYSTIYGRKKPFAPMLNETYECDRTHDLGWKFLAEYYGHFPPSYAGVFYCFYFVFLYFLN